MISNHTSKFVQFGYFFLEDLQRLFGLSAKYTDPSRVYRNQLRFFFAIYLFANLFTWFWFPFTAFIYWIFINFFVFLLFYTDFFDGRFRKRKGRKFDRGEANKTFFENVGNSIDQIVNGVKPKTKEVKKEPKEVYELKREDTKSLRKLPTKYFKEFSPHSNRLQALNGAVPVSTFSPFDEPLEKEIEYTKEESIRPMPSLGRKSKILSKISEAKSESSASSINEEPEEEQAISPPIKVREIKSEYKLMQQRQKEMVAQYENFLTKSAEDFKKLEKQKENTSILSNKKTPASPGKTTPIGKAPGETSATDGKSLLNLGAGVQKPTTSPLLSSQGTKPLINDAQTKPQSDATQKPSFFGGDTAKPQVETVQKSSLFGGDTAKPSGGLFGTSGGLTADSKSALNLKPAETKTETKPGGLFGTSGTTPSTGGIFGGMGASLTKPTSQTTTAPQENKPLLSGGITTGVSSVFDTSKLAPQTATTGGLTSQIKPAQTGQATVSTSAQESVYQSVANSDQTYKEYFKTKGKIVEEIEKLIKDEMAKADVSKVERIPVLRPVIDEVRPRLNTQLTNQLDSILESASVILTKFNENTNNKVVYYGLIYYISDNILKNCEGYFEKGQKLSIYYRVALILILNNQVPGIVEYMILKIAQEIPVLGGVEPKRAPGMSDSDYLKLKGYKFLNEGTREPYKEYDKRMNAYSYFFFMLLTLRLEDVLEDSPDEEKTQDIMRTATKVLRSKLSYDWMYWSFIKFFIKLPLELNAIHILIGFYYSSAYEIKKQPQQVTQLMKLLYTRMVLQLERFGATIQNITERNDFLENKLIFLRSKLKKFHDNDRNGMVILTPIQEAKSEEVKVEDDN